MNKQTWKKFVGVLVLAGASSFLAVACGDDAAKTCTDTQVLAAVNGSAETCYDKCETGVCGVGAKCNAQKICIPNEVSTNNASTNNASTNNASTNNASTNNASTNNTSTNNTNNVEPEFSQTVDGFTVVMVPAAEELTVGANTFAFTLSDANGLVDATSFEVEGWMPAHGHGTEVATTVENTGTGMYDAVVTFNMGGDWDIKVSADDRDFTFSVKVVQ